MHRWAYLAYFTDFGQTINSVKGGSSQPASLSASGTSNVHSHQLVKCSLQGLSSSAHEDCSSCDDGQHPCTDSHLLLLLFEPYHHHHQHKTTPLSSCQGMVKRFYFTCCIKTYMQTFRLACLLLLVTDAIYLPFITKAHHRRTRTPDSQAQRLWSDHRWQNPPPMVTSGEIRAYFADVTWHSTWTLFNSADIFKSMLISLRPPESACIRP